MENLIIRIKEKNGQVQERINNLMIRRGVVPRGKRFIATKDDFVLLKYDLSELPDDEIEKLYSEEELKHVEATLDAYLTGYVREVNLDFSKEVSMQLCKLLAGKLDNSEELLQTLYMTIFQRFNDDIKTDKNYVVTEDLARKLYRFGDETKHPDVVYPETSEKDMGSIYMDTRQFEAINRIADDENKTPMQKREEIRMSMINYVLRNVRNNMMHGHFKNKYDSEGNKIVEIEPYDFKSKFFFNCIEEVYEAIVDDIRENASSYNKTENERLNDEVLFTFQKDILSGNLQNSEVLRDPDKMMRLVVPLFVNSFLTYNFRDKGHFLEVHQELENEGNQEDLQMLNLFYSNGTQDDFISKVESHNGLTNRDKVFAHFRNSVVHNNFECKNGEIMIRDYDRDGNQTADFKVPYSMFLDFFREYSVARNINSNMGRPSQSQSGTEPSDDTDDGR